MDNYRRARQSVLWAQILELARQVAKPESTAFVVNYDCPIEHYETRADGTIGGYVPVKKRKY